MQSTCDECKDTFAARSSRQRFCSDRCRYRAKDRVRMFPCAVCGEPMHRGKSVRAPGAAAHNRCLVEQSPHGLSRYQRHGCRCAVCREASNRRNRKWRETSGFYSRPEVVARVQEYRSRSDVQERTKIARAKWVESNREVLAAGLRVSGARRRAATRLPFTSSQLMERLSMFPGCWICGCALGEDFHVDHVKPLSRGGWHCLANLRPACPACNLSKGAKWPIQV